MEVNARNAQWEIYAEAAWRRVLQEDEALKDWSEEMLAEMGKVYRWGFVSALEVMYQMGVESCAGGVGEPGGDN